MSYNAYETSPYDGHAVELYQFVGVFGTFYLTSYASDYTHTLQLYTATAGLARRTLKLTSSGGASTGQLEISIPFDHALALEYAFTDTPPDLTLTILRGHSGDPDEAFQTIWTGEVTTWTVKNREAKLVVPSSFSKVLNQPIPTKRWQGPCNHLLYDARCTVLRGTYSESTTITSVLGTAINLTALTWTGTEGLGGEILNNTSGERRTIQSHSGVSLVIKLPFANGNIGDSVTVFQGCDHSAQICKDKFNNLVNFAGFNLVPSLNPFSVSTLR